MLHAKSKWMIGKPDHQTAEALANELQVSRFVAEVLTSRGITNVADAQALLGDGQSYDPMLMKGMKEAVDRIQLALNRGEKIRIYGDYDADGVSSTTLMILLLEQLHANFDYYIPHRFREGYGLNMEAIDHAKQNGIDLIITVDNGISAFEQIAYANQLGMDVIVTDHHEPPDQLPPALAIVNPKQPACKYPFKMLAGVGVAYKLAQALLEEVPICFLELTALGTIADIMPLIDENRWFVTRGLKGMSESQLPGMKALLHVSGLTGKQVTASQIGFALGPRINASGRLEHADVAVRLLTAKDKTEAEVYAQELDRLNKERQRIVQQTTEEAVQKLQQSGREHSDPVLLLYDEKWNAGVIGIVASKLLDKYCRPTLVFSVDRETGTAKGSARSVPGFSIYEALKLCEDLLEHYGGHEAAAGMTVKVEHLPLLQQRLNEFAHASLTEENRIPVSNADMKCHLNDIHIEAIEQLERLAPYGNGNPIPTFVICGLRVEKKIMFGKDNQHLKLLVRDPAEPQAESKEALLFGNGVVADLISSSAVLDILVEIGINEWNGRRKLQLLVKDLRVSTKQVLDWRKKSFHLETCDKVLHQLQSSHVRNWRPILLTDVEEQLPVLPKQLQGCQQIHYQKIDQIELNVGEITDLFLLSPPPDMNIWYDIFQKMSHVERIYILFHNPKQQADERLPTREMFKRLYVAVKKLKKWKKSDDSVILHLSKQTNLSPDGVRFGLAVFLELQFVLDLGQYYECATSPVKKSLESSSCYQRRLRENRIRSFWQFSSETEMEKKLLLHTI